MTKSTIEKNILDSIVVGRSEPQIYAFKTQTVPNYLKVGDTYRPVDVRLNEWRKYFPALVEELRKSAKVSDDNYFRDYAVHRFLEYDKRHARLTPETFSDIPYYSNEFFNGASKEEVEEAIRDIKNTFDNNGSKYQFYKMGVKHDKVENIYKRIENYQPRPNQQETIERFKAALKAKRTNLLMYAVMRFGKSFTSMCCAVEMGATNVLVVSGKADVKEEWKKTVESHTKFDGYQFITSKTASNHKNVLKDKKSKKVVFMTLQELCGTKRQKKRSILLALKYDLLIIDETHYGARAENYSEVLKLSDVEVNMHKEYKNDDTATDYDEKAIDLVKTIKAKVRIHLSGTPYRILMSDEFIDKDIIAFYQFTDIIKDKEKWDEEHFDEEGKEEWDNPYYGFPQMVRFAFNPNESSLKKMEELRKNGSTAAFTELFMPCSIEKDTENEGHKKFKHENEVLELMQAIDGSKEDTNVFGFLNYDRIKTGQMCHHIVIVLPFRASCDAMQALLENNKEKFINLGEYEVLNISGVEQPKVFRSSGDVKSRIREAEDNGRKTITLTVCRMLTGSTVEQWDTMIFLKDTASPQEYDQAIFRLQNQYLREYVSADGHVIKYNMKPQTLLVDFKPDRMFRLQEQKSQIYNFNTEKDGNKKLEERIREELRISPIIMLNKERDKLKQVVASDIMDAVRNYSKDKSVMDEASDVEADLGLLNIVDISRIIESYEPIDAAKGLSIKPTEGEGDDIDTDDDDGGQTETSDGGGTPSSTDNTHDKSINNDEENRKKIAACYARILFFASLTPCKVDSLDDILAVMDKDADNKRICKNIGISKALLNSINKYINIRIHRMLDYKISNINTLMRDDTLEPMERINNALKKFGRMSSSEIVTPSNLADDMVATLPIEQASKSTRFLDIAAKQGEFAAALYRRYGDSVKDSVYSIPTSPIAYEFTRKVYNILGMPVKNIFSYFNTYDLVPNKKKAQEGASPEERKKIREENKKNKERIDGIINKLNNMKFNAIIGNPPYQQEGISTRKTPIYHLFYDVAFKLSERVTLITPARFLFLAGQTPKEWMKRMLADSHLKVVRFFQKSVECFPAVDIKGGVAIMFRDTTQSLGPIDFFSNYEELESIFKRVSAHEDFVPGKISLLVSSQGEYRFSEILFKEHPEVSAVQGKGTGAKITSKGFEELTEVFLDNEPTNKSAYIQMLGRIKNVRTYKWIKRSYVQPTKTLDKYKVFVPEANGTGAIGEVLSTPIIGQPIIGQTDTFLSVGPFNTEDEARNCLKYIKSKFARTLLGTLKATQHNAQDTWVNVPLQDFTSSSDIDWSKSIDEIDEQLFDKYGLTDEERAFIRKMIKPME